MSDEIKEPSSLTHHVPENPYDVPISGHDYDGIIELDNQLPNWWLFIFLGSIIFGAIYWLHDISGSGLNNMERLNQSLARIEKQKLNDDQSAPSLSDDEILALAQIDSAMSSAGQNYQGKCASCHGARGEGGIGPSFRDEVWIHGLEVASIKKVINEGVLEKGMPPWQDILKPTEVDELVAYVRNFKQLVP